jgi:LuxR family transcriptional regulator, maltose regulon positive regulatory protein
MANLVLVQTKFLIPRRSTALLPRPLLLAQLRQLAEKRLLVLSAPPGYGKTSLLAEFAAADLPRFAWYQLDETDNDPTLFLAGLIHCVEQLASGGQPPGSAARAALAAAEQSDPRRILKVLINELSEAGFAAAHLLLEDYHSITNPLVHDLLNYLLEHGPDPLRIILSSRSDPPLALARLRARGQLAEMRTSELCLSSAEIAQLAARQQPGLSAESAALLHEKTEGWPTGVQLALAALAGRTPTEAEAFIASLSGTHRFIFEYLSSEVFFRQPAALRQFLLYSSVLGQMNAAACRAVTGIAEAQAQLECLEQQNLFIASLDEQREWFRYHYLFRAFLQAQLKREQPALVGELERRAALFYAQQGICEIAFEHYLRAGLEDEAAHLLSSYAYEYLEWGRVQVLQRMLAALTEPTLRNWPALLLVYGDVWRRLGRAGAAIARYEEAQRLFVAADDQHGLCATLTALAEIARSQGDYGRAQQLASAAVACPLEPSPATHALRARALMAQAKCDGFLIGMDQGRRLAETAVAAARQASGTLSARARAALLRSLGQICWWHGDPYATARYCQEALQSLPDERSPIAAEILMTLATPYLYWRQLDEATHYAEQGLAIAEQLQLSELLPLAYATLGSVLTRRGELARAEGCLRQAMELARDLGLESYALVMAAGFLAQNLCQQSRYEEARQLIESALWPYADSPETYEICVARSVLADIALDTGDLPEAERLFTSLCEIDERRQFRIPLAMVYFGLAYIALRHGRSEAGAHLARESLRLLEPTGTLQLYLDQGERAQVVFNALLANGQQTPLVKRILAAQPEPEPARAAAGVTAVRVQALGSLIVTVGETEVTPERWVSNKARDLLAYFVTFRHERLRLDRVQEELWPELASGSSTAFHTALYRLRQALRSGERSAKFILLHTGTYQLDQARFSIDVQAFDTAIAQARRSDGEHAARWYREAVALYRGDYLEGIEYDWLLPERRRLQVDCLAALRWLTAAALARGDYSEALAVARQALQIDPLLEETHYDLMRAYAGLGQRQQVVRQYEQLQHTLVAELGIEPFLLLNSCCKNSYGEPVSR